MELLGLKAHFDKVAQPVLVQLTPEEAFVSIALCRRVASARVEQ